MDLVVGDGTILGSETHFLAVDAAYDREFEKEGKDLLRSIDTCMLAAPCALHFPNTCVTLSKLLSEN